MTIAIGDKIPAATLKEKTADGVHDINLDDFLKARTVVLFAVPGAFTPTCSLNHLPGFLENRDAFRAKGVDEIAVIAVNDHHVMGAWAKASGGEGKIRFLADGSANFTRAIGLEADLSAGGLGIRSQRYSMLVKDGTLVQLNIEDKPGTAETSGAATLLGQL
ncbi:peroxiredoxin [Rhizobium sp. KVB221]|uniref:Glutathione-dependent peroxiredoxin n=1 Tax=Rhizobium setariae TaxID=2801340 RepID=A0A937CNM3_9HYPH|nr:peroxiredoxin [Rhizobium setariae]